MKTSPIIKLIISDIEKLADAHRTKILQRFFQTRDDGYGAGDIFLGLRVPMVRKIFVNYKKDINIDIAFDLLTNKIHEVRLLALIALVSIYKDKKTSNEDKKIIIDRYIENISKYVNNWDLVDTSCHYMLGDYCVKNKKEKILFDLAKSKNLWERRVAMVSTFSYIQNGEDKIVYELAEKLKTDEHHLIHKAIGWMLREAGKRVSRGTLIEYLKVNLDSLPSVSRSYAMEHLNFVEKQRIRDLRLS
jgi:3-methyladenine DNA glycosylase AlkD